MNRRGFLGFASSALAGLALVRCLGAQPKIESRTVQGCVFVDDYPNEWISPENMRRAVTKYMEARKRFLSRPDWVIMRFE